MPPLAGAVLPDLGRGIAFGAVLVGRICPPVEPGGGKAVELLIAFGCVAGAGRVAELAGTLAGGLPVVAAGA